MIVLKIATIARARCGTAAVTIAGMASLPALAQNAAANPKVTEAVDIATDAYVYV